MSDFESIGKLYAHFDLPVTRDDSVPHLVDDNTANFRIRFLHEELHELEKGYVDCDLVEIADALVDIVVVALGTAHLHGLPWEELFAEVQRSNMEKRRAIRPEESKRGTQLDLVKPCGWTGPHIHRILCEHGWDIDDDLSIG
jgi:hypothetical protein